jgi:hypothetical protein
MNFLLTKGMFVLAMVVLFCVACGSPTGTPTEFSNACAIENDGKTLEVGGILETRSSVYCSNRGGRMECPFDFLESTGSEKKMTADIEVGSGANTVTDIPRGFKKEDIKVRDNAGNEVNLGSDKVKLTGKMMVAPAAPGGQGVCLMQVYKIDR